MALPERRRWGRYVAMKKLLVILAVSAFALGAPLAAQTPEETAAAALKNSPVWDGHNDVPEQVRARYRNLLKDFDFNDTTHAAKSPIRELDNGMHTDLPRLRQGKVGAQFWSVYVDADQPEADSVVQTIE